MLTQSLGYPRIGAKRELKKACENYWTGKISEEELLKVGKLEREKNWQVQKDAGIDIIPCNDFSFYDHVQDMSFMFGAIPKRFLPLKNKISDIDLYFAMCRGYQETNYDLMAMEMTKWFDTNYHYIVPEFYANQEFKLQNTKVVDEFTEAKEFGIENPKPVLTGPLTYLLLGKEKENNFDRLELINKLLAAYFELFELLIKHNCKYIQLDEPFLVTEISEELHNAYNYVYSEIHKRFPGLNIIVTTFFDDLGDNARLALNLPVHALHIDMVRKPGQLKDLIKEIPGNLTLSLGIIDGRNIWKNNFENTLQIIDFALSKLNTEKIWLAPSCSLLHCPYDLELENNEKVLSPEIKNWMAFSKQKLDELLTLNNLAKKEKSSDAKWINQLEENKKLHRNKKKSNLIFNKDVQQKVTELLHKEIKRDSAFEERIKKQDEKFQFKTFPTTTIGSFPQTKEVRSKRREYKQHKITKDEYEKFLKSEIKKTIEWQDEAELDVLVHGEAERNDMVEYFGELLEGFAFTQNGWVQSYGTRAVKPPVIYGDVYRKHHMTLKWIIYAQSLTSKKVKGMLTGPVTILQWSFVRDDQPRKITTFQIANALHNEVLDLENAGIDIIQIDEPALREGLPLKKKDWSLYLDWAVKAFRICYHGVNDETQIHTHMCYCEFNDIIESIAAMDADVISIETSRSDMELLEAFKDFNYPNHIGPGVYDIHSPRIPKTEEMEHLILTAGKYVPAHKIWINPDCGLKTRKWEEVKPALENMVQAAKNLRKKVSVEVEISN